MPVTEEQTELDRAEQVARIFRSIEEARKFADEQHKLSEEAVKLLAESRKLDAETLKCRRDRFLAPLVVVSSFLGAALATTIAHFLH